MAEQTYGTVASPGNTYSPTLIQEYHDKRFFKRLEPNLMMEKFAIVRDLPKQSGGVMRMYRKDNLTPVTTPLASEFSAGTPSSPVTRHWTVEPLLYGFHSKITEEVDLKAPTPEIDEITDVQALQAAMSRERIIRNTLHLKFLNQFANNAASEAVLVNADVLTAKEVRKAVSTLRVNDVMAYEGGMYKLLIHPNQEFDLLGDPAAGGILDLKKYTDPSNLEKGMIGQMWGAKVFSSSEVGTGLGAGSITTYRAFLFGQEAFVLSNLNGGVKTFRFNQGSTENPLALYTTVGWKMRMAAASNYHSATLNPRGCGDL
jgi:N4-gp56 family major capsid protein